MRMLDYKINKSKSRRRHVTKPQTLRPPFETLAAKTSATDRMTIVDDPVIYTEHE